MQNNKVSGRVELVQIRRVEHPIRPEWPRGFSFYVSPPMLSMGLVLVLLVAAVTTILRVTALLARYRGVF